jgi:phage-related protein
MRSVGPGVVEIRVHTGGEYRLLYVARFAEGVYVLHAFEKKTRQTRKVEQASRNLAEVAHHRRR